LKQEPPMLTVMRPERIGWQGALGFRIKIRYTLICLEKGQRLITSRVSGDAFSLFAFVNIGKAKFLIHFGVGNLVNRFGR
jgi:hypothetical protein